MPATAQVSCSTILPFSPFGVVTVTVCALGLDGVNTTRHGVTRTPPALRHDVSGLIAAGALDCELTPAEAGLNWLVDPAQPAITEAAARVAMIVRIDCANAQRGLNTFPPSNISYETLQRAEVYRADARVEHILSKAC